MNRTPVSAFVLCSLAAILAVGRSQAQTYTWNNSASANFSAASWLGGLPSSGPNAELVFGDPNSNTLFYTATNDLGSFNLNSLVFNSNASVSLTTNVITIAGTSANPFVFVSNLSGTLPQIRQDGSATIAMTATLQFNNSTTVRGSGLGLLAFNNFAATPVGATFTGSGNLIIDRAQPASAYRYSASYTLINATTATSYTGNLILQQGNLILGATNPLGTTSPIIVNGSNSSLQFLSTAVIGNPIQMNATLNLAGSSGATFNGIVSGSSDLNITPLSSGTSAYTFTAANTNSGNLTIRHRGFIVSNASTVTFSGAAGTMAQATSYDVYTADTLSLVNGATNVSGRLNSAATMQLFSGNYSQGGNTTAGTSESIATLRTFGSSTITITPATGQLNQLTIGNWDRQGNSTVQFSGTTTFGTNVANASRVTLTANPGGSIGGGVGSTQQAILPYAIVDVGAATTTPNRVAARYDTALSRIVQNNPVSDYQQNLYTQGPLQPLANFRSSSLGGTSEFRSTGVGGMNAPLTLNSLVLETSSGVMGTGALTITSGSILSTNQTQFTYVQGSPSPMIGTPSLAFGGNTGYIHLYQDLDITSSITGTGGLVLSGRGVARLAGNNTFSGGLFLNGSGGGLYFSNDANFGAASNQITLAGGGLAPQDSTHVSTGTQSSFTLSRTINVTAAGGLIAPGINNMSLNISGPINGSGPISIYGNGVVNFSNVSNSFAGDLSVLGTATNNQMVFRVSSDAALGHSSNSIYLNNATLQLDSSVILNRQITFQGITAGVYSTIFTPSGSTSINGVISSPINVGTQANALRTDVPLLKVGAGNLALNATNTYVGPTQIGDATPLLRSGSATRAEPGGFLILSGVNASISQSSAININSGGTLWLDNTLGVNANRVSSVPFTLRNGTLLFTGNSAQSTSESISTLTSTAGSGNLIIDQPGASVLTTTLNLTALSTTANGFNIIRGTNLGLSGVPSARVVVANPPTPVNSLIPNAAGGATSSGGPVDFLTYGANGVTVFTGYGSVAVPGATVTALQSGGTATLTANTDLNALKLGNNGQVNLNGNTLTVGSATQTGMILASGGGTQQLLGGTLAFGPTVATFINDTDLTVTSALTGTNGLMKVGAGVLTLSGSGTGITGTNSIIVDNGTLRYGTGVTNALPTGAPVTVQSGATLDLNNNSVTLHSINGLGTVAIGTGTLTLSNTVASVIGGQITGSGTLVKQGTLTTSLLGDNAGFSGSVQIDNGILSAQTPTALGTSTAAITIGSATATTTTGTGLQLGSYLTSFNRNINVVTSAQPAILENLGATLDVTGNINLNSGTSLRLLGLTTSIGNLGPQTNYTGTISGAGALHIDRGTHRFANANTYTGGTVFRSTTANEAIVIGFANDASFGTGAITVNFSGGANSNFYLRPDGGARTLTNAINFLSGVGGSLNVIGVNNLNFAGPIDLGNTTRNMTVQNSAVSTISGALSNGGIFKDGAGMLVISSSNPTQNLTVNGGVVLVNGQMGATTLSGGGVLGGNGTVTTLQPSLFTSHIISPGSNPTAENNGVGILSVTSTLNLNNSTSTFVFDLNGPTPGVDQDQLRVGQATVASTVNVTNVNLSLRLRYDPTGQNITLVDNIGSSSVTGTFAGLANNTTISLGTYNNIQYSGTIRYDGFTGTDNDIVIVNIIPVPEPGSLLVVAALTSSLAWRLRRRMV